MSVDNIFPTVLFNLGIVRWFLVCGLVAVYQCMCVCAVMYIFIFAVMFTAA
jgi:hypothetical protein